MTLRITLPPCSQPTLHMHQPANILLQWALNTLVACGLWPAQHFLNRWALLCVQCSHTVHTVFPLQWEVTSGTISSNHLLFPSVHRFNFPINGHFPLPFCSQHRSLCNNVFYTSLIPRAGSMRTDFCSVCSLPYHSALNSTLHLSRMHQMAKTWASDKNNTECMPIVYSATWILEAECFW